MGALAPDNSHSAAQLIDAMPEAFVSTAAISREVSRQFKAGRLRKLGSRLYTANLVDAPEAIVRRNLWDIVGGYFPGALIADRTALENAPAADGSVCLVAQGGGTLVLPGIILRPRRGAGPQESDRPFLAELFLSFTARAWLDNLRPSRSRAGRLPRTLSRRELEDRLDSLIRRAGVGAAYQLRDEARALAPAIDRTAEAERLNALVGAVLGTGSNRAAPLSSPLAQARHRGRPYDPARLQLFQTLHGALRDMPPSFRPAGERDSEAAATLAFYDAYFSNFIEGTEFAVEEAADILFQGRIPSERPADAHDVLGVWKIVSKDAEASGFHAFPGRGGTSVHGRKRTHRSHHDECRTRGRRRGTHHYPHGLSRQLLGGPARLDPQRRPGTPDPHLGLRATLDGGGGLAHGGDHGEGTGRMQRLLGIRKR